MLTAATTIDCKYCVQNSEHLRGDQTVRLYFSFSSSPKPSCCSFSLPQTSYKIEQNKDIEEQNINKVVE